MKNLYTHVKIAGFEDVKKKQKNKLNNTFFQQKENDKRDPLRSLPGQPH